MHAELGRVLLEIETVEADIKSKEEKEDERNSDDITPAVK